MSPWFSKSHEFLLFNSFFFPSLLSILSIVIDIDRCCHSTDVNIYLFVSKSHGGGIGMKEGSVFIHRGTFEKNKCFNGGAIGFSLNGKVKLKIWMLLEDFASVLFFLIVYLTHFFQELFTLKLWMSRLTCSCSGTEGARECVILSWKPSY